MLKHFNMAYTDIEPFGQRTADGTPFYGPSVPPRTFSVNPNGWSQVTTYWPPDIAERLLHYDAKDGYIEISPEWDDRIEMISSVISVGHDDVRDVNNPNLMEMDVLVRSLTGETEYITTQDRFCSLRPATAEHHDQMTSFRMAYLCREEEEDLMVAPEAGRDAFPDILKRTTQM